MKLMVLPLAIKYRESIRVSKLDFGTPLPRASLASVAQGITRLPVPCIATHRVEVKACASEVDRVVRRGVPTTIVSSLPFKSMARPEALRCAGALAAALGGSPGSRLVQYSYGFGIQPPFEAPPELRWAKAGVVLRNVPPATVWTLQRASADT